MKLLSAMLTVLFMAPLAARADVYPDRCFEREAGLQKYYDYGQSAGKRMARRAWASRLIERDCDKKELYKETILDRISALLNAPGGPGSVDRDSTLFPQSICRWYGYLEGMAEEAGDVIVDECNVACQKRGEFWGDFGARMYCDLSIAFDGLGLLDLCLPPRVPGPAETCEEVWEEACDNSYGMTAHGNALPGFDLDPDNPYEGCHRVDLDNSSYFAIEDEDENFDFTGTNDDHPKADEADFTPVYDESVLDHCQYTTEE